MEEKRTREWIHKPVFHGAPASLPLARDYFRGRVARFREEHKEFDTFLNDLYVYLKKEKDSDYKNLCLFIEGEAAPNWISPDGGLFDIYIRLFNLCLSSKQAFEYIKECHEWYLIMSNAEYEIIDKPEFSIRRSTWDGKYTKFVDFDILPKGQPKIWDYYYWFHICTSLKTIEDSSITDKVKLVCGHKKLHDALMLFSNHQNKPFPRNIFNTALKGLLKTGDIKEKNEEQFYDWVINYYDTVLNFDLEDTFHGK